MNYQEEQVVLARITMGAVRRDIIACARAIANAKAGENKNDYINDMEMLIKAYRNTQVSLKNSEELARALGVEL